LRNNVSPPTSCRSKQPVIAYQVEFGRRHQGGQLLHEFGRGETAS
jgi:hypothetical protein